MTLVVPDMKPSSAQLLVAVADRVVWIKIRGRANFSASVDFKTLIRELRARGYQRFILELSECALMDSTFLGMLAGFGLRRDSAEAGAATACTIELLHPNPRITELLDTLGLLPMFRILTEAPPMPQVTESREAGLSGHTPKEMAETSLEAHRVLMDLSPANVARFKDVAQFLAEDLKRL